MAIYVFITKECIEEAHQNQVITALDRFKKKIERAPQGAYRSLFTPFPQPFLVKKKFGGRQGRLIASHTNVEVHGISYQVLVFLSYMTRSNTEYGRFYENPDSTGKQYLARIDEDQIRNELSDRLEKEPIPRPTPLSADLENFIGEGSIQHGSLLDEMICESEEWVEGIQNEKYINSLSSICTTLLYHLDARNFGEYQLKSIEVEDRTEWKILVSFFPDDRKWFLIGISDDEKDLDSLEQKYSYLLSPNSLSSDDSLLTKCTRRMYSHDFLADHDVWFELQKNPLGNFALSPEEIDILTPNQHGKLFPLFINGRAGSGKSTVLQYLFADYLCRYIRSSGMKYPPVYLTCSKSLLESAKKLVKSLLKCNEKVKEKLAKELNDDEIEGIFDRSFKEFHLYLRSLVPEKDRDRVFPLDRHIGYSEFKARWQEEGFRERGADIKYGPDISWHVIRSYIKGLIIDDYLEPEDYKGLGNRGESGEGDNLKHIHKTVDTETYEKIYNKVWVNWYKKLTDPETGTHWDDQDLVRYLLAGTNHSDNDTNGDTDIHPAEDRDSNGYFEEKFAGIFCDESQDFTRIELDAIMRLSLFSGLAVRSDQIPYIPIAFAGDEYQTLNPTGFRWDTLGAWFTEKFIFALDPDNKMGIKINLKNLNQNYRSLAPIVRFSNRVQLLRAARFGIDGIEPQETWKDNEGSDVVYYQHNDANFWNNVPENTVLIVPADDNASVEKYIEKNLSTRITLDEDGTPQEITVLSPTEAKGLEFECVAVYGFAGDCPDGLLSPFTASRWNDSSSVEIPREYFINKVYVSVTRARRLLIILDDFRQIGDRKRDFFWNFAIESDHTIFPSICKTKYYKNKWKNSASLTTMFPGHPDLLTGYKETPSEKKELAFNLKKKGLDENNSGLLRQAAVKFKEAKIMKEVEECHAEAFRLEKRFLPAGDRFVALGHFEKAIDCYWKKADREGWKEIAKLTHVNDIRVRFSELLVSSKTSYGDVKSKLQEVFNEEVAKLKMDSSAWQEAITALLKKLNIKDTNEGKEALTEFMRLCVEIHQKGLDFSFKPLMEKAEKYQWFDFINQTLENLPHKIKEKYVDYEKKVKEYDIRSKADSLPYPENLRYMVKIPDYEKCLQEYRENKDQSLNAESLSIVLDAMISQNDATDLEWILPLIQNVDKYREAEAKFRKKNEAAWADKCHTMSIVATIHHYNGPPLEYEPFYSSNAHSKETILAITRTIARRSITGELGQKVYDFLKLEYIDRDFETLRLLHVSEEIWMEIGTAFERAGHFINAIKFYEKAEEYSKTSKKIEFQKRWIACKRRYADRRHADKFKKASAKREAEEKGKSIGIADITEISKSPVSFDDWLPIYRDIASGLPMETASPWDRESSTDIPSKNIPQTNPTPDTELSSSSQTLRNDVPQESFSHPPLMIEPKPSVTPSRKQKFELSFGGFQWTYYPENNRINLVADADGKVISINRDGGESNDYTFVRLDDGWNKIPDTSIHFKVLANESSSLVQVYDNDSGINIYFAGKNPDQG